MSRNELNWPTVEAEFFRDMSGSSAASPSCCSDDDSLDDAVAFDFGVDNSLPFAGKSFDASTNSN